MNCTNGFRLVLNRPVIEQISRSPEDRNAFNNDLFSCSLYFDYFILLIL